MSSRSLVCRPSLTAASSRGGQGTEHLPGFLPPRRTLIPSGAPLSWPDYPLEAPPPNTSLLVTRVSTCEFWKDTNMQVLSSPKTQQHLKMVKKGSLERELRSGRRRGRCRETEEALFPGAVRASGSHSGTPAERPRLSLSGSSNPSSLCSPPTTLCCFF